MKSECPRPESNPSAFLTFKPHARFVESGSLRGQAMVAFGHSHGCLRALCCRATVGAATARRSCCDLAHQGPTPLASHLPNKTVRAPLTQMPMLAALRGAHDRHRAALRGVHHDPVNGHRAVDLLDGHSSRSRDSPGGRTWRGVGVGVGVSPRRRGSSPSGGVGVGGRMWMGRRRRYNFWFWPIFLWRRRRRHLLVAAGHTLLGGGTMFWLGPWARRGRRCASPRAGPGARRARPRGGRQHDHCEHCAKRHCGKATRR